MAATTVCPRWTVWECPATGCSAQAWKRASVWSWESEDCGNVWVVVVPVASYCFIQRMHRFGVQGKECDVASCFTHRFHRLDVHVRECDVDRLFTQRIHRSAKSSLPCSQLFHSTNSSLCRVDHDDIGIVFAIDIFLIIVPLIFFIAPIPILLFIALAVIMWWWSSSLPCRRRHRRGHRHRRGGGRGDSCSCRGRRGCRRHRRHRSYAPREDDARQRLFQHLSNSAQHVETREAFDVAELTGAAEVRVSWHKELECVHLTFMG